MFGLELYLLLSYIGGVFFAIMTLNHDRILTIADVIMFFLAPFTIMPILFVQLLSQFIDLDKPVFRI